MEIDKNIVNKKLLVKINETISYCHSNVEFYQRRLKKILEGGFVNSIEEFRNLPFTTKEDVKKYYPYGLKGADLQQIVAYNDSSGTSSGDVNRSSRSASFYTQKDVDRDIIRRTDGDLKFNSNDVVFVALPYALTTSGIHYHQAANKAGAMVINADNGSSMSNIRKQIDLIRRLNPSIIITSYPFLFSSMFHILGVSKNELINLRAIQLCGMSTSSEGKKKISSLFNNVKVYDTYGMSEFGAITATCDCGKSHINDDFYIEVINPKTLENVENGVGGEIVITTFEREGSPKIRYRTGDVGKISPTVCSCGRTEPTIEITGRLKDLIVVDNRRFNLNDFENVIYSHNAVAGMYKPEIMKENIKFTIDILSEEFEETSVELKKMFWDKLGITVEVICVPEGEARKEMLKKTQEGTLKSLQSINQEGNSEEEWLVTY